MMHRMTFSPSAQAAKAIKNRAKKEGKSVSKVINEMLEERIASNPSPADREAYRVEVFDLNLRPEFDHTKLNELALERDQE